MFEEAQLYSPVTENEDGKVTVELAGDHPGANDPAYRERRNQIAAQALAWEPGEPIPGSSTASRARGLADRLTRARGQARAATPAATTSRPPPRSSCRPTASRSSTRSPTGLRPLTGFRYHAAAGLVPLRDFYGSLGDGVFHSTQYMRHDACRSTRRSPTSSTR